MFKKIVPLMFLATSLMQCAELASIPALQPETSQGSTSLARSSISSKNPSPTKDSLGEVDLAAEEAFAPKSQPQKDLDTDFPPTELDANTEIVTAEETTEAAAISVATLDKSKGTPSASSSPAGKALVDEALTQWKSGHLDAAEWTLEDAIRLDPNNPSAYYWMAKLKIKQGKPDQALSFISKTESLTRGSSAWQNKVAEIKSQAR